MGKPGALHLVEEDELLDRAAALSAVFLGPADTEPPIGAQPLHRLVIERSATFGFIELSEELVGDEVVEIRAELVAQCFLLGGVVEIHGLTLLGAMAEVKRVLVSHGLDSKPSGGQPRKKPAPVSRLSP